MHLLFENIENIFMGRVLLNATLLILLMTLVMRNENYGSKAVQAGFCFQAICQLPFDVFLTKPTFRKIFTIAQGKLCDMKLEMVQYFQSGAFWIWERRWQDCQIFIDLTYSNLWICYAVSDSLHFYLGHYFRL